MALPEFDPNQPFTPGISNNAPEFDPGKPFTVASGQSSPVPASDHHAIFPTIGRTLKAIPTVAINAGQGALNALENPTQTLQDIGSSVAGVDAEGIYRTIRSAPLIGTPVKSIVDSVHSLGDLASNDWDPNKAQTASDLRQEQEKKADQAHAEAHPLTDFIQRTLPMLALPHEAIPQIATMAMDAFQRSMASGNSTIDALNDAKNVAALSGMATMVGKGISSGTSKVAGDFAENVGVSPETIENYGASEVASPLVAMRESRSPISNFPTKEQLNYELKGEIPKASQVASSTPQDLMAGANEGTHYADLLGDKVGTAVGGAVGFMTGGHSLGSTLIGAPVGAMVGKAAGKLMDTYGAPAVKVALDAGLVLDKIAETPYIGPLMKAAAEGPKSLAITHYMLNQSDPKYQALSVGKE